MGPLRALEAQRGHLFPWAPVLLAIGIGLYFALRVEPSVWVFAAAAGLGVLLGLAATRWPGRWGPVLAGIALVALGLALAGGRSHLVAAPKLEHRFYGAVEGRVLALDRSLSDAPRLTLDRVWLEGIPPGATPARIRLSLHSPWGLNAPVPGTRVAAMAHLSPPAAPAEPGGFDFRRHAWFDRLGAVGYARGPAVAMSALAGGLSLPVNRVRMHLSAALRARLPGDQGAFAAAILTGDRSAMSRGTVENLRDANLAHLLAISGLHMGLLTAVVFGGLRFGLALIPWLVLRAPIKKIAAVGALGAGSAYLALSGGNVATERAFVMVAVVLGAVLADRRALTLRAVAVAALIVLLLAPESLTQAGFQMSFAATAALVAVFSALRDLPERFQRVPRALRAPLAVVLSSVVAGLATAPFGAAHFNQVAQYGLLANLLSVPLMGTLVIPAAVVAACLAPFGLAGLGLEPMRWGIAWILGVADWVAGLEGAVWPVVAPGPFVLPLLALGAVWVLLWQGRARWGGVAPVVAALVIWAQTARPPLLIAESGGLIGVIGPEGRALSKPRGEGFVALSWLENDGDLADQETAFARPGLGGTPTARWAMVGDTRITLTTGRGWQDHIGPACQMGWVVVPQTVTSPPEGCILFDRRHLEKTGAIAIWAGPEGPRIVGAREVAGRRPWSQ
ncbi:DNA internalization-related competence protein ComEC/Rec2 [Rhodovulum sp. P5]|uniref:ComEC/Rec2 family competence protein n=1 Tax=Rhodovulum sp. P5 TaxID=1564506 RepID=UPI0009C2631C|nr:ComEC/Rec2 family competence protein [Rhodovulum sp. P5]ARE38545.1 DNA internalization-related competence protein ComEC/Rec2 [Rhodovulum sp. P5]